MHNINNMLNPDTQHIIQWILAEQEGTITAEDKAALYTWAAQSRANQAFIDRCQDKEAAAEALAAMDKTNSEAALRRFKKQYRQELYIGQPRAAIRPLQWVAAAVVLGLVATAGWWFFLRTGKPIAPPQQVVQVPATILPITGDQVTLTLANGKVIPLNDSHDGELAREGGAKVNKKGDALEYHIDGTPAQGEVVWNTVSTPKGGFYRLKLPDETQVWLNAQSSIRFPTAFAGKERTVSVTGEVYFEVTKRANQPFMVQVDGGPMVKVLGTHFNINAYKDVPVVMTTLLEGKVQVYGNSQEVVIKPGQQAAVPASAGKIAVQEVNTEDVVAWKEGYFSFQKVTVSDIMREVQRWYDVDIVFEDQIPGIFIAYLPRNLPLNSLLSILEATDKVTFHIEGKKNTITKKSI